ncbi:MAG: TonB-dependent receptor [Caulobacteraceae bacterium]|nr:TonB-dependent receptor [Caulobacteraceae bacterium]
MQGGNYGRWGLEGTITGPITDSLRYRINMARYKQEEGFFRNVEDGHTEGDRFGNRTLLDLMLAGNVGDKIDFFLKGSGFWYYETLRDTASTAPFSAGSNNPCIQVPFASTATQVPSNAYGTFGPGSATTCGAFTSASGAVGFNPLPTVYGNGILVPPASVGGNLRDFISNYHSDLHLENYHLVSFDTTYHAPLMDIRYIVGHSRYHYTQSSDNDGSPVNTFILPAQAQTALGGGLFFNTTAPRLIDANGVNIYQEEPSWYSNEINFTSTWDGPLQGIVGLYQYNQFTRQPTATLVYQGMPELLTPYTIGLGLTGPSFQPVGFAPFNQMGATSQWGVQKTRQNTYAAFTQWDYKFSDKWTLTAGVRYNSDKERADEEARFVSNNALLGAGPTNVSYNNYGGGGGNPSGAPFAPGVSQISGPFAFDVSSVFAPGFAVISPNTAGVYPSVPARYSLLNPASVPGVGPSPVPLTRCGANATLLYTGVQLCSNDRIEFGPGVQYVKVDPLTGNRLRRSVGKWHSVTGGFSLSYKPNDDSLYYVRYAKGYRPGGFGSTTAGFMPLNPYADKETLDTWELGSKVTLFNKLQLNADLFYYDYKNIQIQLSRFERCITPGDISTCAAVSSVVNLPSGVNQGFELTSRYYVTQDLQLTLNYGYLDAHIKNGLTEDLFGFEDTGDPAALLPTANRLNVITCTPPSSVPIAPAVTPPALNPLCPRAGEPNAGVGNVNVGKLLDPVTLQPRYTQDISGNELPNAPHHKIAANISYTWRLAPGNLTASYSYIWRSAAFSQPDVFEEKIGEVPPYSQSDARLIFRSKDSDWQFIIWGNNIFDQTTYESGGVTRRGSGYTPAQAAACGASTCAQQQVFYRSYVLLPPRTFGVEFNKKFR